MRRPVAAVVVAIVVAVVLLLAGCGGEPTTQTSSPGGTAGGTAAAPPKPPTAVSTATVDLTSKPITVPRPFPKVDAQSAPRSVVDALAAKRAFMIVFYDSRQVVTGDQKAVIDGLAKRFRGLIEFISFDLATLYKAADGSAAKKNATLAADLAQKLNVGYQPAIVITTNSGQITWQSTGFYDAGTLEREILRATQ